MSKLSADEKVLIKKITSGRRNEVISGLEAIKQSGTAFVIPELFRLLTSEVDEAVIAETLYILSNIRTPAAVPIFIDALKAHDYGENRSAVLSLFWQSPLDFSGHLEYFVELFFTCDYVCAIEVFTVIEEILIEIPGDRAQQILDRLTDNREQVLPEILPLYTELRKVVEELT